MKLAFSLVDTVQYSMGLLQADSETRLKSIVNHLPKTCIFLQLLIVLLLSIRNTQNPVFIYEYSASQLHTWLMLMLQCYKMLQFFGRILTQISHQNINIIFYKKLLQWARFCQENDILQHWKYNFKKLLHLGFQLQCSTPSVLEMRIAFLF